MSKEKKWSPKEILPVEELELIREATSELQGASDRFPGGDSPPRRGLMGALIFLQLVIDEQDKIQKELADKPPDTFSLVNTVRLKEHIKEITGLGTDGPWAFRERFRAALDHVWTVWAEEKSKKG